jgi:hypothetical protein
LYIPRVTVAPDIVYSTSQEERSIFREVIVSVILSKRKKKYICTCVLFRTVSEIVISLYGSKIVYKEELLRTVSNTGIYCYSDNVGTVYLL